MIKNKYKDLYLSTTRKQVKKLSDFLLYLEKKPSNQNLIENIFRLIHSMKGAAATMGYKKTVNLLHAMESVIDAAYNEDIRINNKILNVLFDTLNILKDNFDNIDAKNKEVTLTKHIKSLKGLFNQKQKKRNKQAKNRHILGSLPNVSEVTVSTNSLDAMSATLDDLLINMMKMKKKVYDYEDVDFLKAAVNNDKLLTNLRKQLENLRVVALKDILSSLPYLVREVAREEGKQVDIEIYDHDLSLDKSVSDELIEILIQLLKNAVSHGISKQQKKAKIIIDFSLVGDRMHVSVSDNGKGINWIEILELAVKNKIITRQKAKSMTLDEIKKLIFSAGISRGKILNTTSGRGVGLNLVKTKIEELDADIKVSSNPKKGTEFLIDLPQPLTVFRGMIFELMAYNFALPLNYVEEIIVSEKLKINHNSKTFTYKKKKYKIVFLSKIFAIKEFDVLYNYIALITYKNKRIAIPIIKKVREDELVMQKTPLILKTNKYIKGTAISVRGQAILVLNINNLI